MNRARHLLRSSLIVIILYGLDKVVGLLRTVLVSDAFGISPEYDAFTAANQLPEVFVTLIAGGALAAAFIPVYSQYLTGRTAREAARLAHSILTLVLLVLGSVSAVGALFAPWITRVLLVPDFSPELQTLTGELMRIILVQTTLFGISGLLSSILNAHQHFALPALAPMTLHIGYLVGLFLFVPAMGIHGLAWGTVVGGLLHILIQVPALLRYRISYRPDLSLSLSGVREIIRLMGPRIVTLGVIQLADLIIIRITSGLDEGSTSAYFYGYYLQQLPETLFGTAIAIVVFPTLAEYFNSGRIAEMKRLAMNTLRIIWWLTIPAAAGLILLGRPAIALVLQRGAFDETATNLVYGVLIYFSLRVVSEASLEILARLFYAQHNTLVPMLAAGVWFLITAPLSYLLVGPLGVGGLALASSLAFTVQSTILLVLNRARLGPLGGRVLALGLGRTMLATAGMALVILATGQVLGAGPLFLLVGGAAGGLTYVLLSLLLRGEEIPQLWRLVRGQGVPEAAEA